MNRWTRVVCSILLILFTAFAVSPVLSPARALPGDASDPIVTKLWVDNALDEAFSTLQSSMDDLARKLEKMRRITLVIDSPQAYVNSVLHNLDVAPRLINGYTFLPVRFLGEALSIDIAWDAASQSVICKSGDLTVILPVDGKKALVSGTEYELPAAPVMENGRVLVPVRFIGEAFSCSVQWEDAEKRITVKNF